MTPHRISRGRWAMPRWKGKKLLFEEKEIAWNQRTSRFPIWAARVDGDRVVFRQVGVTQKHRFAVELPDGFACLVRFYESNLGEPYYHTYFPTGEVVTIYHPSALRYLEHPHPVIRALAYRVVHGHWPEWLKIEVPA